MTKNQAINTVLQTAQNEIGYLEKKSNAQLDSKTANAGSNNYTKYWRDVYPAFQGQAWCACFVSWCFMKSFGKAYAQKLLKHWPYTYCPTLASITTNKKPEAGSIIIFYRNGTYTHTGLVAEVNGSTIITIEGNTSGASGVIANGGGVCKKSYSFSSLSSATKFFVPDYKILSGMDSSASDSAPADSALDRSWLQLGDVGSAVKEMQQLLIEAGYSCGPDGADGDFGKNTYNAVVQFQKDHGLTVDGEYGKASKAKLLEILNKQQSTPSGSLNKTVRFNGTVTTELNVRSYAGTEYDLCSFSPLSEGAVIGICDTLKGTDGNDWYYILYNEKYGFVSAKYVKKQ